MDNKELLALVTELGEMLQSVTYALKPKQIQRLREVFAKHKEIVDEYRE